MKILQSFNSVLFCPWVPCSRMKQGKLQNYFDSNVHSVSPASSVLHVASSTEWEEGSETGSPCTLGGSGCNFQDLPGTKTRTKFLVTFFFQWKLVMLSLVRSKISAILILTGAASGVTDVSETPCTPLSPFPPPKNNSFIHREAKMEKSMVGSCMPTYL